MSCLKSALVILVITVSLCASTTRAQQTQNAIPEAQVPGPPYDVPEIRVYLTDEDSKKALNDQEIFIQYVWDWNVLNKTARTPWMELTNKIELKARTDSNGMVLIPARIILPSRPIAPDGVQLSEPTFQHVTIEVYDDHHNCGLYIWKDDIEKYRVGEITDFHRSVPRRTPQ